MAADFGLFIGFGGVKAGREKEALQVFIEAQQYNEQLKQRGEIESYETVLLELHGGDLDGFTLLRGTPTKLNRLRYEDEQFLSLITKSAMLVNNLGVVGAALGDRILKQTAIFQNSIEAVRGAAKVGSR